MGGGGGVERGDERANFVVDNTKGVTLGVQPGSYDDRFHRLDHRERGGGRASEREGGGSERANFVVDNAKGVTLGVQPGSYDDSTG